MEELKRLCQLHGMSSAPLTHGYDLVILTCHVGFEQYSYENWDTAWFVELPWCYHYWKSTKGWRKGNNDLPIVFSGRTADDAIGGAKEFLENMLNQDVRLGTEDTRRPKGCAHSRRGGSRV